MVQWEPDPRSLILELLAFLKERFVSEFLGHEVIFARNGVSVRERFSVSGETPVKISFLKVLDGGSLEPNGDAIEVNGQEEMMRVLRDNVLFGPCYMAHIDTVVDLPEGQFKVYGTAVKTNGGLMAITPFMVK